MRTCGLPSRRFVPVAAVLALLLGMTGCSQPSTAPSTASVNLSQLYWILSQTDMAFIQTADPQIASSMLDGPSTFVLMQPAADTGRPLPARAVPAMLFTSFSAFKSSLREGGISSGVRAVAYDPEFWRFTPQEEQLDPVRYMELFAAEAKRSGYQTILVPGRDLALTPGGQCAKRPGETLNTAYLRCGVAQAARFAPIFEIQAAPVELDIPELRSFVAASVREAHAANPSAVVMATLSTTPGGTSASSAELVQAARAILPYVRGFQLNTTRATRGIAVDFLRALSGAS